MPVLNSFSTPAQIEDLPQDPQQQQELNALWSTNVDGFVQQAIAGNPWNIVGASNQNYFFNPLVTEIPSGATPITAPVVWSAFPNRLTQYLGEGQPSTNPYGLSQEQLWQLADTGYYTDGTGQQQTFQLIPTNLCPQTNWKGSLHLYGPYGPRGWMDEYCEWSVKRNAKGKISRVDFVCENPEYWYTLWRISPQTAALRYQDALNAGLPADSPDQITVSVEDLQLHDPSTGQPVIDPSTGMPAYNPLNKWNQGPLSIRGTGNDSGGAMHLTSTPNTLQTELGLGGGATVARQSGNSDPQQLICCSQYGQEFRHSDPHIGQSVNQIVNMSPSKGYRATLADPVGLYIQMPDFSGYQLPHDPNLPAGAQPADCWQIVRGSETLTNPLTGQDYPTNFITHAVFQIPQSWIEAGVQFTVGDILINTTGQPQPINWAAQIAETFQVGFSAWAIPNSPQPPLPCVSDLDPPQAQPVQMMYEELWNAYYGTNIPNPVGSPMSLASNSVIIPPVVRQGDNGLRMVLTCSTATQGPNGELPQVTVPSQEIAIGTVAMTTISYAAPGNSYPSPFQLLTLEVNVLPNAQPGLQGIQVTNYGQLPGEPAPAFFNVVASTALSP